MIEREAIVVGGGPAGSAAAWELKRRGIDCLILEKESFPRAKLCAGWITPDVLQDLKITPADYPHRFLTFERLDISLKGLRFPMHSRQHSIRRFEFDHWLLDRSCASVDRHQVKTVVADDHGYVLDDKYRCRYLVGAGGTRCPVFRELFRPIQPRPKSVQCATLELEYPYEWKDPGCYLWFLTDRLPGYAWYVPKENGYLNIGVGGLATILQSRGDHIRKHWDKLVGRLLKRGLISEDPGRPTGYSYFLRSKTTPERIGNAFVIGDSAGLATQDMCEGIGPAIRSGVLAAQDIDGGNKYSLDTVAPCTLEATLPRKLLQHMFIEPQYRM